MIQLKGEPTAAFVNELATANSLVYVGGMAQYAYPNGMSYYVPVTVQRPRYSDWRDNDRLLLSIVMADPWFGLYQLPYGGAFSRPVEGIGALAWAGISGIRLPNGGQSIGAAGAYVVDLAAQWFYSLNYPIYNTYHSQALEGDEADDYTLWLGSLPNTTQHVYGNDRALKGVVVACVLSDVRELEDWTNQAALYIGTSQGSVAANSWASLWHWSATTCKVPQMVRAIRPDGTPGDPVQAVDSDVAGQKVPAIIEVGGAAVYTFAARDAVTWTRAPEGTEIIYRTPAGVAPSVMLCLEQFTQRHYDETRTAEVDGASYLWCQIQYWQPREHNRIRMAAHPGGPLPQARTMGRNLMDRYLLPIHEGENPYPTRQHTNALRTYVHKNGQPDDPVTSGYGETQVDDWPCDHPNVLARSDGSVHLIYTKWRAVRHQVSADGGESYTAMPDIAEGYEAVAAALDEARGLIVCMLYGDDEPYDGIAEWKITVGTLGSGGSYSWTTPRVVRIVADQPLYGKRHGATLLRMPDGSWWFVFTGLRTVLTPPEPADWYQRAIRCKNLLPDGTGTWEAVPDA